MNAKAVWVVENGKIEVRDSNVPDPQPNQVTVEVKACGVCAWDSYLFQGITAPGPFPYVIGHEAVGIINKIGASVHNVKPGDKVFCAGGCNIMMAEYVTMPAANVVRIPDDTTDYVKWVAEPTCCTVNVLYRTNVEPGDQVVLVGAGYMGLLTLMGLRSYAAGSVTVFDIRDDRLELAKKYNPTAVYNPNTEAGKAAIKKIQEEGGADVVIEFSASDAGFALANELTSRQGSGPKLGGKLTIGSWHRHNMTFDGTLWHMSGLTVMNLSPMSNRNYKTLLPRTGELIRKGVYTPGDLVTHVADYRNCSDVFRRSIDKKEGYIKGVVTF